MQKNLSETQKYTSLLPNAFSTETDESESTIPRPHITKSAEDQRRSREAEWNSQSCWMGLDRDRSQHRHESVQYYKKQQVSQHCSRLGIVSAQRLGFQNKSQTKENWVLTLCNIRFAEMIKNKYRVYQRNGNKLNVHFPCTGYTYILLTWSLLQSRTMHVFFCQKLISSNPPPGRVIIGHGPTTCILFKWTVWPKRKTAWRGGTPFKYFTHTDVTAEITIHLHFHSPAKHI